MSTAPVLEQQLPVVLTYVRHLAGKTLSVSLGHLILEQLRFLGLARLWLKGLVVVQV